MGDFVIVVATIAAAAQHPAVGELATVFRYSKKLMSRNFATAGSPARTERSRLHQSGVPASVRAIAAAAATSVTPYRPGRGRDLRADQPLI